MKLQYCTQVKNAISSTGKIWFPTKNSTGLKEAKSKRVLQQSDRKSNNATDESVHVPSGLMTCVQYQSETRINLLQLKGSSFQSWKVTFTILRYLYFAWVFLFYPTLCYYFITFLRQTLYFISTTFIYELTSYFSDFYIKKTPLRLNQWLQACLVCGLLWKKQCFIKQTFPFWTSHMVWFQYYFETQTGNIIQYLNI